MKFNNNRVLDEEDVQLRFFMVVYRALLGEYSVHNVQLLVTCNDNNINVIRQLSL